MASPSGNSSTLSTPTLTQNIGSSLELTGVGTNGNSLLVVATPTQINSMLPRVVVVENNGFFDFATWTSSTASIAAITNYNTLNNLDGAIATDNLLITANTNGTASRTINSLNITDSAWGVA